MTEARRPSFAADFPREPALDGLVDAFARGDYACVRAGAPALASSEDATVRDAAKTLVERTRPDPLATALLAITAALLVLVSVYWSVHGKAPAQQQLPSGPPVEHVRS
jgi:hypothetical protein